MNTFIKKHSILLILTMTLFALFIFGQDAIKIFRYDRGAILNYELWRLITGHLSHLTVTHALLNLTGLMIIWFIFFSYLSTKQWLIVIVTSMLTIDLLFLILNPELKWYAGMSGVLHGMFIAGCIVAIKPGAHLEIALLIGVILKLLWEQYAGPAQISIELTGGDVITEAHLYGAIGGGIVALFFALKKNPISTNRTRYAE